MLNALLMFGSTNKKMKKINWFCMIMWFIFMFMNADFKTGAIFTLINAAVFFFTFGLGQFAKGKYSNTIVSVCSILIWSILIDIISFYMYPQFTMGQNIIGYIYNGIVFNAKYILLNIFVLSILYGYEFMVNKKFLGLRKKNALAKA